ncbi:helix-hairpin-helix domain-containing protein, partial [Bacteroidales bacterium OttesenSCG-928-K03]|nr:helix-hairpin-helix domain-containing protein [Bacteroidales bacterium OttesenSCG-928-K03]
MKEYMFFSKSDRRNIVTLCVIIILLSVFRVIFSNYKTKKEYLKYSKEVLLVEDSIRHKIDSAIILANNKEQQSQDITSTKQNRNPEKDIVRNEDGKQKPMFKQQEKKVLVIEINSVDSVGLLPLPGIGPVFAGRIISYRERLGGYFFKEQLLEIKYFTREMLEKISDNITIDTSKINMLKINQLEFRDILRHPYVVDYEMTKVIVNERNKMHFTSAEDFVSRTGIEDTLLV